MNATASMTRKSDYWIAAALLAITLMIGATAQPAGAQETGGPAVIDPTSCGHFESQEDAQEALHSDDLPNSESLDPDGDGIACEMRWPVDPVSPPAVYDPTSCGHFETQEDAQAAYNSGDLPEPENLDADGDGIVCEFRWGEVETDAGGSSADGADTGTDVVVLPDTGAGTAAMGGHGATLIALLALVCAGGGLLSRARRCA